MQYVHVRSTGAAVLSVTYPCACASILRLPSLTVRSVESQQQSGGDDCGLFSIATATSLCHGIPPSAVMWDERVMRLHLEACFTKGIVTPFPGWDTPHPSIRSVGDEPVMSERVLVLHCVCRLPEDKKRRMASCTKCGKWFHDSCENIPVAVFKRKAIFVCSSYLLLLYWSLCCFH